VKRQTMDQLEALAFAEHIQIEIDSEQGIAVATLGGVTYYARLDDVAAAS